jgi:MFS transporter, SP family, arabinose:H+ symporter
MTAPALPRAAPEARITAKPTLSVYVAFVCTVASLGGFLFGYDSIVISGALPLLKAEFHLTAATEGLFVSASLLGCMMSAPFAGAICDRSGRRAVLLAAAILTLVATIACTMATSVGMLLAARWMCGLGVGAASMVCPLYISELAPEQSRGRLVSLYQFSITLGICVSLCSNAAVAAVVRHHTAPYGVGFWHHVLTDETWRVMIATQALPSAVFLALCLWLPETPRWLTKVGRGSEALAVLRRYVSAADASHTVAAILENMKEGSEERAASYRTLLERRFRRPLAIALFLGAASELSGITVVFYYGPAILNDAGFGLGGALNGFVIIGAVNMLATIIALWLIDRVGRRPLLFVGTAGAILCLCVIGACLGGATRGEKLLIVAICCYVAFYAFSIGPVKFAVSSEIFPNAVRGRAVAVFIFVVFAAGALVNQLFPLARDSFGVNASFYVFALILVPQLLFVWRVMPETAGRTLEQIEHAWRAHGRSQAEGQVR